VLRRVRAHVIGLLQGYLSMRTVVVTLATKTSKAQAADKSGSAVRGRATLETSDLVDGATLLPGGRSAQETVHLPLVEVATSTVGESPSTRTCLLIPRVLGSSPRLAPGRSDGIQAGLSVASTFGTSRDCRGAR